MADIFQPERSLRSLSTSPRARPFVTGTPAPNPSSMSTGDSEPKAEPAASVAASRARLLFERRAACPFRPQGFRRCNLAGSIPERPTRRTTLRFVSALLALCLLAPSAAAWSKGQKNYKQGLKHEAAQQWEKAA